MAEKKISLQNADPPRFFDLKDEPGFATSVIAIIGSLLKNGPQTVAETMRDVNKHTGIRLSSNNAAGIHNRLVKKNLLNRTQKKGTIPGTGRLYQIDENGVRDFKLVLAHREKEVQFMQYCLSGFDENGSEKESTLGSKPNLVNVHPINQSLLNGVGKG